MLSRSAVTGWKKSEVRTISIGLTESNGPRLPFVKTNRLSIYCEKPDGIDDNIKEMEGTISGFALLIKNLISS